MGLHPSEILIGYEKASKKCLEILEELTCFRIENLREKGELKRCIKSAIASKQYGLEEFLAEKISEACLYALPTDAKKFNVDNVRV
jgi:T-complex protein 1 subunit theta